LKKHSKSRRQSEPTLKRTKSRGPVQRDVKQVIEQVGTIGTGGSAVVVSDSTPQSGSAPRSGGTASPGRVGIGADGVNQEHARTGEKYGHTTAALFESEFRRKGKGCDS
jgi:hypothetical protein